MYTSCCKEVISFSRVCVYINLANIYHVMNTLQKTHKYIDQTKLTVLNSRGMCFAVTSSKEKIHYKPRAVNSRPRV